MRRVLLGRWTPNRLQITVHTIFRIIINAKIACSLIPDVEEIGKNDDLVKMESALEKMLEFFVVNYRGIRCDRRIQELDLFGSLQAILVKHASKCLIEWHSDSFRKRVSD